jgi:hypothetical protein
VEKIPTPKKIKQPKVKIPKAKPVKKPKPIKEPKLKKQKEVPIEEPLIKQDLISPESELPLKDQERLAILERLKTRVAAGEITPMQPKPIEPPMPVVVPPPPLIIPKPQNLPDTSSPIHTYKSDFADEIDAKHASTFSVLAAEKDAPTKKIAPVRTKRNSSGVITIVIGMTLLFAGGGALAGAYEYVIKNAPAPLVLGPASLISYDSKALLSGSGNDLMTQLAQKADEALPLNSVLLTYINESTTTPQGVTEQPATGGAVITELNLQAPNVLLRNISPDSMVGIVHAGNDSRPFFILKVDSYQSTFAGMLQWEPTMLSSLGRLYPLYPEPVAQQTTLASTSKSASTTLAQTIPATFVPQIDPSAPSSSGFVDEIVANHSTRALKDNSGRTVLMYGYYNKAILIIARNESAFELLVSRLTTSGN